MHHGWVFRIVTASPKPPNLLRDKTSPGEDKQKSYTKRVYDDSTAKFPLNCYYLLLLGHDQNNK